jgi:hypothetical protein
MSSSHHHSKPTGGPGYETTDADVPMIIKSGAGLMILVFFGFGLMFLMFYALDSIQSRFRGGPEPTLMQLQKSIPNAPLLQVDQSLDLRLRKARDEHDLTSYTKDAKTGAIHIPVDRAIEILASRGLPEPKGPPAPAAPKPAAQGKK